MGNTSLHVDDVDELRRIAAAGGALPIVLPSAGVGAALELACTISGLREARDPWRFAQAWIQSDDKLERAWSALNVRASVQVDDHGVAPWEIAAVTEPTRLGLFTQRFKKSLQALGGFSHEMSMALAGALGEMADNVLQHSGPSPSDPAPGIAAFEVFSARFEFAVADTGRGLLESLRGNPAWRGLKGEREALRAAMLNGATRRIGLGPGTGFSTAIRALADLRGHVRVRSADAYLDVDGGDPSRRVGSEGQCFQKLGVHVLVSGTRL